MKKFLTFLGGVTLVILIIGGLIGALGIFGVWKVSNFADQPSKQILEGTYGASIDAVTEFVSSEEDWNTFDPPAGIVAIAEIDSSDEMVFIYPGDKKVKKSGHVLINGAGTSTISVDGQAHKSPTYVYEIGSVTHWIFFEEGQLPEPDKASDGIEENGTTSTPEPEEEELEPENDNQDIQ